MTDRLELHIIELEKLERRNNKSKEEEELLNWCKFIKFPEKVEESIIMKNEEIKKAKEQLDKISQDKKERRLAELREKAIDVTKDVLKEALAKAHNARMKILDVMIDAIITIANMINTRSGVAIDNRLLT